MHTLKVCYLGTGMENIDQTVKKKVLWPLSRQAGFFPHFFFPDTCRDMHTCICTPHRPHLLQEACLRDHCLHKNVVIWSIFFSFPRVVWEVVGNKGIKEQEEQTLQCSGNPRQKKQRKKQSTWTKRTAFHKTCSSLHIFTCFWLLKRACDWIAQSQSATPPFRITSLWARAILWGSSCNQSFGASSSSQWTQ